MRNGDLGPPITFKPGDRVRHKADPSRMMVVLWVSQPARAFVWTLYSQMGHVRCRYPRTGMSVAVPSRGERGPDRPDDFAEQGFFPYELVAVD